ncbi:MAG: hypothetical protein ACRCXB_34085 [Aeromonadaceae bacterium]
MDDNQLDKAKKIMLEYAKKTKEKYSASLSLKCQNDSGRLCGKKK